MRTIFLDRLRHWSMLFLIAAMVLNPLIIIAQGRTFTRANQFDHGGLKGGDYLKIEELVIFEGTWQWVSAAGDSVFTLQLWREKFVPPVDLQTHLFSYDGIAGHYSLSVHGRVVSTNLNKRLDFGHPTLGGSDMDDDGVDLLDFSFNDFVKSKRARGQLELFRDNPNKARWSMRNMETIVVPTGTIFHRGFSLPNNIVLNRVQVSPPPLP